MQVVLVMFRGEDARRSFSVARDVSVIGRREDCDFRIPLGEISRKHCRLIRDNDALRVEDLGSSNGTYVNGLRVQEAVLGPGDTIQVGPVMFVVQVDGQPGEEDMHPVAIVSEATGPSDSGRLREPLLPLRARRQDGRGSSAARLPPSTSLANRSAVMSHPARR